MTKENFTVNITEVTVMSGKKKGFRLSVDDRDVVIPVDQEVFVRYQEQFHRPNPTPAQRKKFATVHNLLRAAYKKGFQDGEKGSPK
jgi:hypothetical protein